MVLVALVALAVVVVSFAKYKHLSPISWNMHNKINQAVFSNDAIEGYDPIAYFTEQKAVKGEKSYSYQWKDATWYFSSAENMKMFKGNPEKYAPQFGGYCSFAVSKGFTAKIDPQAWKVIDGKLYLFNDETFRSKWESEPERNMEKDRINSFIGF